MTDEKSLGQIAHDIYCPDCIQISWNKNGEAEKLFENMAQAVIDEWQRRNGKPVVWYNPENFVRIVTEKTETEYAALYSAPQIPSEKEIKQVLLDAGCRTDECNQIAIIVVEFLRRTNVP